jgi:SAM-dependent methyltransferase
LATPLDINGLLADQLEYYRSTAAEYVEHSIPGKWSTPLSAALDSFRPAGRVLDLACGPASWTPQLLRYATDVTAVDAAPEMLAIAASRITDNRVRFVEADLFAWTPASRFDVVFFAFWLSHVPEERFTTFWSLVAECLTSDGRVFFVDDDYYTPSGLPARKPGSGIQHRINSGITYRVVKVSRQPADLEERLSTLGWRISVRQTSGNLIWGAGARS